MPQRSVISSLPALTHDAHEYSPQRANLAVRYMINTAIDVLLD